MLFIQFELQIKVCFVTLVHYPFRTHAVSLSFFRPFMSPRVRFTWRSQLKFTCNIFFFFICRIINSTPSFFFRRITLAFPPQTIDKLPDKVLLRIFSYLSHREIINNAFVCKRWRTLAYNTNLWDSVSFRPERQGLCVNSIDTMLYLIGWVWRSAGAEGHCLRLGLLLPRNLMHFFLSFHVCINKVEWRPNIQTLKGCLLVSP